MGLALRKGRTSDRRACAILAGLWLWVGAAYHLWHFTRINPAPYGFGAPSVSQGILILRAGTFRGDLKFRPRVDPSGVLGVILIVFALLVYPLLNYSSGHRYPESPTFGLPCPTTIFTLGMFLWTVALPRYLLVVPAVWTLIGGTAVFLFGMAEDTGLLIAGAVAIPILIWSGRRRSGGGPPPTVGSECQ